MEWLSIIFFFIAFLYSMVGFGGGSSYTALLVASGLVHFTNIPLISLSCNLIVVTGSLFQFKKHNNLDIKLIIPFLLTSIPFTFFGSQILISKFYFLIILGIALFVSAINLMFNQSKDFKANNNDSLLLSLSIGAILGLISGLVGIGGGIFLAPTLYFLKWREPKIIASTATLFIFINSIIGIYGHLIKTNFDYPEGSILLLLSVFLGGQIGSRICNKKLSPLALTRSTGALILFISIRIIYLSFLA